MKCKWNGGAVRLNHISMSYGQLDGQISLLDTGHSGTLPGQFIM